MTDLGLVLITVGLTVCLVALYLALRAMQTTMDGLRARLLVQADALDDLDADLVALTARLDRLVATRAPLTHRPGREALRARQQARGPS